MSPAVANREVVSEAWLVRRCKAFGLKCPKGSLLGPGYPDRVIFGFNGKTLWLELKTPAGELRIKQKEIIGYLRSMGHAVEIPRTRDEIRRGVYTHLGVRL